MESNHNQIVSLIWNIADDVLRDGSSPVVTKLAVALSS